MDEIRVGLRGEAWTTVTENLTAQAMSSGDLPVYATPAMIALMEEAAVAAVSSLLPPDETSVGLMISVEHLRAAPIGSRIRSQAETIEVENRQIVFVVSAWHGEILIGEGRHTRVVVNRERFLQRVTRE
jgi:predicted thioesterase